MFKKLLLTALIISPNIAFTANTNSEIKKSVFDPEVEKSVSEYAICLAYFNIAMQILTFRIPPKEKEKFQKLSFEVTEIYYMLEEKCKRKLVEKLEQKLENTKKKLVTLYNLTEQDIEGYFELMKKVSKSNQVLETKIIDKGLYPKYREYLNLLKY